MKRFVFITGGVVSRWEGAVFIAYYVAYTVYLVLAAQHHDAVAKSDVSGSNRDPIRLTGRTPST